MAGCWGLGVAALSSILTLVILQQIRAASGTHVTSVKQKSGNTIKSVETTCTEDTLEVQITLHRPFQGLLYSKGYPLECRAEGSGTKEVKLVVPASGCGVRVTPMKEGKLTYIMNVDIQFDRHLQQAIDQQRLVTCELPEERVVYSAPVTLPPGPPTAQHYKSSPRLGKKENFGEVKPTRRSEAVTVPSDKRATTRRHAMSEHVTSWMEVTGARDPSSAGLVKPTVLVGEQTTMMIKTKQPANLGTRVVDCVAHDGSGDSQQRLLDEFGCPIDDQILPALRQRRDPNTGLQVAVASFPAFKFPDRDSLHLRCGVLVCRGTCPQSDCGSKDSQEESSSVTPQTEGRRDRKHKLSEEANFAGQVIDRLEVFNSVEVKAPGIELQTSTLDNLESDESSSDSYPQGDRTFCLSPSKVALAFGALGAIFICAVAVALYMFMKGRHHKPRGHHLMAPRYWPYVRVLH